MKPEERKALIKAKAKYSLTGEEELSEEDQEAIDTFMEYVKSGK